MLKDLIRLANHLDTKGLRREADMLDKVANKLAEHNDFYSEEEPSDEDLQNAEAFESSLNLGEGSLFESLNEMVDNKEISLEQMLAVANELLANTTQEYRQNTEKQLKLAVYQTLNNQLQAASSGNIFSPLENESTETFN